MAPHAGVDWSALDTRGYVTASLDTDWYWSHFILFKYSSCWLQDRFYVWYMYSTNECLITHSLILQPLDRTHASTNAEAGSVLVAHNHC